MECDDDKGEGDCDIGCEELEVINNALSCAGGAREKAVFDSENSMSA